MALPDTAHLMAARRRGAPGACLVLVRRPARAGRRGARGARRRPRRRWCAGGHQKRVQAAAALPGQRLQHLRARIGFPMTNRVCYPIDNPQRSELRQARRRLPGNAAPPARRFPTPHSALAAAARLLCGQGTTCAGGNRTCSHPPASSLPACLERQRAGRLALLTSPPGHGPPRNGTAARCQRPERHNKTRRALRGRAARPMRRCGSRARARSPSRQGRRTPARRAGARAQRAQGRGRPRVRPGRCAPAPRC